MKPNILFLVHVEGAFRKHFPRMLVPRLVRAVRARKYSEVIVMESQLGGDDYELIPELKELGGIHCIQWGWGYEKDEFKDDPEEHPFIIPSSGHDYTWVPPELRAMASRLSHSRVFVGGGSESECLQDFVDCLEHLNLAYTKVPGYIY